jgi:hypothetical protein
MTSEERVSLFHAHGVASMVCCCSGLFSQRRQQFLSEIKQSLLIEAYVVEVGQDVPLRDRDGGRLSLDDNLPPEVLALFDDTQPIAVSVMWSPILLVGRLVFHLGPLFKQGQRMSWSDPTSRVYCIMSRSV